MGEKELKIQATKITLFLMEGDIRFKLSISDELLLKCRLAFNNHRGKFQWEEKAIFNVLKNENIIRKN